MSAMPEVSDTLVPAPGEPARVRPARIRDWARLVVLARRLFPDLDEQRLGHWLREERHSLIVAITAQGLVGFARLVVQPGRRVTLIECLGVDSSAREQGVGSALLRYCADVACACGAPQLEGTLADGDLAAQAFCVHHGFCIDRVCVVPAAGASATVRRKVQPPVWPLWDLRRLHAPRVPPAVLERVATRALFEAWLGRSTARSRGVGAATPLHPA